MEIRFHTEKLRKLCNDSNVALKALGQEAQVKLRRRLDDLDAAENLEALRHLPGHCEELKSDRAGQLSLRLAGGLRLILVPDHEPPPVKPDGGLNWQEVKAVVIIEVVDYHG
jgi:plasmid maintenance system killer protein